MPRRADRGLAPGATGAALELVCREPWRRVKVLDLPDGAEYLVSKRYRTGSQNLRTQFKRILDRAGVDPWEKLFHNMRATRQTELAAIFPLHVVCTWLGNRAAIAGEHYLTVRDSDFAKAVGEATQNPTQQPHAGCHNDSQDSLPEMKNPANCGAFRKPAWSCDYPNKNLIPPTGLEPVSSG